MGPVRLRRIRDRHQVLDQPRDGPRAPAVAALPLGNDVLYPPVEQLKESYFVGLHRTCLFPSTRVASFGTPLKVIVTNRRSTATGVARSSSTFPLAA